MSEEALFPPLGAYDIPAFDGLDRGAFASAFDHAMTAHRAEIDAIADNADPATFDDTIAAMERAGEALERTASSFFALAGADTDDTIQRIERDVAPKLSRHSSAIALNAKLFARIAAVHAGKGALPPEDARLVDRVHTGFVRGGAKLEGEARERLAAINARLSELGTAFSQNVLADEKSFAMPLGADDLAGLPDFVVAGMAEAARERGLDAPYALTLSRSIVVPFLTFSDRRDLREAAFRAWIARGENEGPTDNRAIIAETLKLRAEKARLLGFASYAAFKLDDTMAKTPGAVRALLTEVWEQAVTRARTDATALAGLVAQGGANEPLEPWDWRYYAEKRRRAEFAIDEAALKPYFQLDRMIEAAFDVAGRLFGLSFERLADAAAWRPEVRVWRVRDRDGREVGLFLGDYFARSSKRSGAWMSALRDQHKLDGGHQTPIIYNVMNFARPPEGRPALLSMDDARTLFHEFGHALHGLLSNVTWPRLSGTSVSRDFVELPSQLFEHWLTVPEILKRHAIHAETGEPLPPELVEKLEKARTFDAGFDAVEYTASALVDLSLHETGEAPSDPAAREAEILGELKLPREIVMRHRSPHFAHIFAGEGYSAGYYSYMWSEVLDADAFDAFTESGDPFDEKTAALLLANVYSAGGTKDPAELYRAFRGRMPTSAALLRKRGFAPADAEPR